MSATTVLDQVDVGELEISPSGEIRLSSMHFAEPTTAEPGKATGPSTDDAAGGSGENVKFDVWIPIFKIGEHTDAGGRRRKWDEATLKKIVEVNNAIAADRDDHRLVPFVLGHPKDDHPAWGWVREFRYSAGQLFARVAEMHRAVYAAIKQGRYRFLSMSINVETLEINHVGLLGAAQPAIAGLKPFSSVVGAKKYCAEKKLSTATVDSDGALADFTMQLTADETPDGESPDTAEDETTDGILRATYTNLKKLINILKNKGVTLMDYNAEVVEADATEVDSAVASAVAETENVPAGSISAAQYNDLIRQNQELLQRLDKMDKDLADAREFHRTASSDRVLSGWLADGRINNLQAATLRPTVESLFKSLDANEFTASVEAIGKVLTEKSADSFFADDQSRNDFIGMIVTPDDVSGADASDFKSRVQAITAQVPERDRRRALEQQIAAEAVRRFNMAKGTDGAKTVNTFMHEVAAEVGTKINIGA